MTPTTETVPNLTAGAAQRLIRAAVDEAALVGKPFCISVLDRSGVTLSFQRLPGAPLHSERISRNKAYTAVSFKAPSEAWFERAKPFGESGVAMVAAAVDDLVPMAGGVPITVDGEVVGAVGVSGGTALEDKRVAEAAIAAVLESERQAPDAVAGYFAALRANDPDAWASVFAADAVGYDPAGTPPLVGRDAFRTMLTGFLPTWGRFDGIQEDEVITAGPVTSVRWTGSGVSAGGNPVRWSGINTFFLDDDGLISSFYAVFDADELSRQLAN
ncbi:heme-binding protein [Cnuibacter sp. UC19_7]|uniref:heme-binding protein n=1 Tax=Cnuibacter sp. UC19_7 TaxID=3350166 RepID=UPI0036719738